MGRELIPGSMAAGAGVRGARELFPLLGLVRE